MKTTRRGFLGHSAALPLAPLAFGTSLPLAGQASAATLDTEDYRAIVCVFMHGGNDHDNTIVPMDSANFASYQLYRGSLAYHANELKIGGNDIRVANNQILTNVYGGPARPLSQMTLVGAGQVARNASLDGRQFSLSPTLSSLYSKYQSGKLAVLLNIGTLVQPMIKSKFYDRQVKRPPQIGSHNDQTAYWQSGGIEGFSVGWGGRIGDIIASQNDRPAFTCISVSGNTVLLAGREVLQYQVKEGGLLDFTPLRTAFGSDTVGNALGQLITDTELTPQQMMGREHARITTRAIDSGDQLREALALTPESAMFPPSQPFTAGLKNSTSGLGRQLAMVARVIHARKHLGLKRQVFFVSIGNFDNHSGLAGVHPTQTQTVADAMSAFHDWSVYAGLGNNVTTFTGSEFGRQIVSNGNGSDHGWGSHQLVLGGAVNGGHVYGIAPSFVSTQSTRFENNDHLYTSGVLIPTTPVDQLAAQLATWMGVADAADMLPHLANFSQQPDPLQGLLQA